MYLKKCKKKEDVKKLMKSNPDFIVPMIYDVISKDLFKRNNKLLALLIRNVIGENVREDDIFPEYENIPRIQFDEKRKEQDICIKNFDKVTNLEINSGIRRTKSLDYKNITYVGSLMSFYYGKTIRQINFQRYDIIDDKDEIQKFTFKNERGKSRKNKVYIYDVNVAKFKNISYTNSKYEKEFIILMKIFLLDSKKEIKKVIGNNEFMKEVYAMHESLSNERFVLKHFPDELFHQMEKEEEREEGRKTGLIEGAKNKTLELAKKMLKKGIDTSSISEITGLSIENISKL